eukprot:359513-Chlamydomonas_euryale.AAC.1
MEEVVLQRQFTVQVRDFKIVLVYCGQGGGERPSICTSNSARRSNYHMVACRRSCPLLSLVEAATVVSLSHLPKHSCKPGRVAAPYCLGVLRAGRRGRGGGLTSTRKCAAVPVQVRHRFGVDVKAALSLSDSCTSAAGQYAHVHTHALSATCRLPLAVPATLRSLPPHTLFP